MNYFILQLDPAGAWRKPENGAVVTVVDITAKRTALMADYDRRLAYYNDLLAHPEKLQVQRPGRAAVVIDGKTLLAAVPEYVDTKPMVPLPVLPSHFGSGYVDQNAFVVAKGLVPSSTVYLKSTVDAKILELTLAHQTALRQGILVGGITLGAEDTDRSVFNQLMVLLREAEELQPNEDTKAAFRAADQTITDLDGTPHVMAITALRQLIVGYGLGISELWIKLLTKRAQVLGAASVEGINAITWNS